MKKDSSSSCFTLASKFYDQKEYDKAFEFARSACDLRSPEGCNILGKVYLIRKDLKRSLGPFYKACKNDIGQGCFNLGAVFTKNKEHKKALKYYKKGCDDVLKPYGKSCIKYSDSLEDSAHKKIYLKKACQAGLKIHCEKQKS